MPTLLILFGMRFYFYLDEHEPIHVHIDCNGKKAKMEDDDMEKIKNLWFDGNRIYIRTTEGQIKSRPLEAYPELLEASVADRNDYMIDDDGEGIRWDKLDADMHISSFYQTTEPNYNNEVAAMFARFPWLNVSEVARRMDINKSLLSRYIYGISKPSQQRVEQIRSALHSFGKELISA